MSAKGNKHDSLQDQNVAKLVMSTFYKLVEQKHQTTSVDIARYLQENFGDVWRTNVLLNKAEQTLSRSAALGFLDKNGKRYAVNMGRGACCLTKQLRRKRSCASRRRRRRRSCACMRRRRRRSSRRPRKRRRRKGGCRCSS